MPAPREVFFLIDVDGVVLHREASDSPIAIPDARSRWEIIWENRERVGEIAHSHPIGPLAFSREDETTFEALESALGRELVFSVVAPDGMIRRQADRDERVECEPSWAAELRLASGMSLEKAARSKEQGEVSEGAKPRLTGEGSEPASAPESPPSETERAPRARREK
ncbi:MAG: hypothetical protein U0414_05535 [Polyangiaceae bacterium]